MEPGVLPLPGAVLYCSIIWNVLAGGLKKSSPVFGS
jgi:hypothetical protein